jgi:hypothetical protein
LPALLTQRHFQRFTLGRDGALLGESVRFEGFALGLKLRA